MASFWLKIKLPPKKLEDLVVLIFLLPSDQLTILDSIYLSKALSTLKIIEFPIAAPTIAKSISCSKLLSKVPNPSKSKLTQIKP